MVNVDKIGPGTILSARRSWHGLERGDLVEVRTDRLGWNNWYVVTPLGKVYLRDPTVGDLLHLFSLHEETELVSGC